MGGSGFHLPGRVACQRQMGCSWGGPSTSSSPTPQKLSFPCPLPFIPSLLGHWDWGRGEVIFPKAGKVNVH